MLEYWQWIGLFLIIIAGSIADKVLAWVLKLNVSRWQKHHPAFETVDNNVLRPLGLMAMALMWWSGLNALGLPDTALVILLVAVKLLVSLSGIWSAFRIVDVFNALWTGRALKTQNKFDDLLVPMVSKSLKVFVVVIGIVFAADNLNIDVTSLLAGLGLGGLAFALAAKDLLGNFFGSVTVLLDRPFSIGDWVVIGDIEGTVEMIRLRDTHIRKLSRELLIVPNTHMFKNTLEILTDETSRRHEIITGVAYHTDLEQAREGIRKAVASADGVDPERPVDVLATQFNDSSIDFTVRWWSGSSIPDMLNSRDSVVRRIKIALDKAEIEIPFPQVTHNFREPIRVESEGKT